MIPASLSGRERLRLAAVVGAVGLVLADSSIVVLALPEIFRQFESTIEGVSWVLVAFNVTLALVAVPAARWSRRHAPGRALGLGLAVSAGATLACGLSGDLATLIAARTVQGIGGAAAITASLVLMSDILGGDRRAIPLWVAAGVIAAALGPAVGGLLTEFVSWQAVFLVQVPFYLLVAVPLFGTVVSRTREMPGPARAPIERPNLPANLALGLTSAAIAATLFLIVVLLIEGWRLTPVGAAVVVTVLPISTLIGARIGRRVPDPRIRAMTGAVLLAGGLAGLGLLPGALVVLTLPPQVLAGIGLAFVLSALTEAALRDRRDISLQAGWTIASRHAGVVIGIVILTPIFTAALEHQRDRAVDAGTATLLDSDLTTTAKLDLAERLPAELEQEGDRRVPRIEGAFEPLPEDPDERAAVIELRDGLNDQVDRAVTSAFAPAFLLAALAALLALIPIRSLRRSEQ